MNWKKPLLACAALLLAPLVGEGVVRAVLAVRGESYDAERARQRFEASLAALDGDMVPDERDDKARGSNAFFLHPYYAWETRPGHRRLVRDVEGFATGKAEEHFTVVIVGGSVAGQFAEPQSGASDVLASALEADPRLSGRRVRVLSHGRGAFKEPQQLFVLAWLFALGVEPDAVINIDGFNELAISNQNTSFDTHPLYPSYPQWGPRLRANMLNADPVRFDAVSAARAHLRELAQTALDRRYFQSAILGRLALGRVERANLEWQEAQVALLESSRNTQSGSDSQGPPFSGKVEQVVDLAVRCWRETSRDLEAVCRRRGILYLHALQPTLHDQGSKPLTQQEIESGEAIREWTAAIQLGYPRLREEGARLAAEGFPFYDASRLFAEVEQTLYFDACHFERAGNELLAQALAPRLLALLPPS
jgi:hypothetical protein